MNKIKSLIAAVCLVFVGLGSLYANPGVGMQTNKDLRPSPVINVRQDSKAKGASRENAQGDGITDDTQSIQAAIDNLSKRKGGTVLVPAGVYRVSRLTLVDGVTLAGEGPDKTIFRALEDNSCMIRMLGGNLLDCSLYGTDEAGSGANWEKGSGGKGLAGTAKPLACIRVEGGAQSVTISNVHAYEAKYDPLYVQECTGLRVLNSRFDRAGRNVVCIVGDTDDFIFSDCYFGSLWGLYHFDIEPNKGKSVTNGQFIKCEFDGSRSGEMGTDTWGSFLGFCVNTGLPLGSHSITVKECRFKNIWIRVRSVFTGVKFIDNHFDLAKPVFVKVSAKEVGEFRDAEIRGNTFENGKQSSKNIVSGAAFTGNLIVENNRPTSANSAIKNAK